MAQYRGIARLIKRNELTSHTLTHELNTLISPKEDYRQAAKHLSQLIQSKPFPAPERVVRLTEHAIQFDVAHNLDMFSRQLNTWQYYGLDIYVPVLTIVALAAYIMFVVTRLVVSVSWRLVCQSRTRMVKGNKLD